MDNTTIREKMSALRQSSSRADQLSAAKNATQLLIHHDIFLRAQRIACYMAVRGELNTQAIIQAMLSMGKTCYLPILNASGMEFAEYYPGDPLVSNQFGIFEPMPSARVIVPWALDLVVMPVVAFDQKGNRLGSGCGYYDKAFSKKSHWPRSPYLCGFAYAFQQVHSFKVYDWDVPMDMVVTEQEIQ